MRDFFQNSHPESNDLLSIVEKLPGLGTSSSSSSPSSSFLCLPKARKVSSSYSGRGHETVEEILERGSRHGNDNHAFFAVDLGEPIRRVRRWREELPRVEPFYAVKCNSNSGMLKTLAEEGIGFDCASKEEIATVLRLGVGPSRIIFANPCKAASHLRYAACNDVALMTFDNGDELRKIKEHFPEARLVLRILADDSRSACRFGAKFGTSAAAVPRLLALARDLGLSVVGVSFHVGSGCFDPTAFSDAVAVARTAFDTAEALGFPMRLLDLGGGFPGLDGVDGAPFSLIAACLREALETHFPASSPSFSALRIIAEPGRYFAAAAFTLAVSVNARRVIDMIEPPEEEEDGSSPSSPSFMYYVSDGVYGAFNCLLFDHAKVVPKVLRRKGRGIFQNGNHQDMEEKEAEQLFECSLWGPTCDSMDCISRKEFLPALEVGDWLYFENMGAYTLAAATTFNGFPQATLFYTNTEA